MAYNFSKAKLADNMSRMIGFFNEQVKTFPKAAAKGSR